MEIFEATKSFPKEETYSLIDQIRRSSNHFVSKLTDANMENGETQAWLDTSLACKYISEEKFKDMNKQSEEVTHLLIYMINNPDKFK